LLGACKEEELDAAGGAKGDACDPEATDGEMACAEGLSCSPSASNPGDSVCGTPYLLRGLVFDALSEDAVEGALVSAFDVTNAPVTDVAVTDAAGNYELEVPVPRDDAGEPVDGVKFTLMASAADYQPFPAGTRPAIPVDIADAMPGEDGDDEDEDPDNEIIENATTEIGLIPLPDEETGGFRIEGDVVADDPAGTLVVAEGFDGPPRWTVSDLSGHYVLFNVPDGAGTVAGYRADLQVDPATVDVAGADQEGIDLLELDDSLANVSGTVNIVNAPGGSATSVVLIPSTVFNDALERGPVPFGLRAPDPGLEPNISSAWTIEGVPAGTYKVLAAFENDDLVRDPDEGIAGTQIVEITVAGQDMDVGDSFKITEALEVFSPGAEGPEAVTEAPDFVFADDSSEDLYHVVLYDALGELVWEDAAVDGVSGGERVTVSYGGDALTPGMYYQYRATSKRDKMGDVTSISRTEDLRGVFVFQPEG
jgi:hypothetical protein